MAAWQAAQAQQRLDRQAAEQQRCAFQALHTCLIRLLSLLAGRAGAAPPELPSCQAGAV